MLAADPIAIAIIINGNIQQMNKLNSTIEVIPQQVQPVQHSELLLLFRRVLVVVLVVVLVILVVVKVGVGIGAPVAAAIEDENRGCGGGGGCCDGGGGCGGFPVE